MYCFSTPPAESTATWVQVSFTHGVHVSMPWWSAWHMAGLPEYVVYS